MQLDRELANCIRALAIDAVQNANSGHPGMPLGMADAATVLFANHLKFLADEPTWADRDRFLLSNGHGSMLQYALLYLTGYAGMPLEEIKAFRQLGSKTPGHPEYGVTEGVEATTGPLGQGLAMAVGLAIAEQLMAEQFGKEVVDHRTWVFVGDGCLMEGVGQEAVSLAGHLGLEKLIAVFDNNQITIDGDTGLARTENIKVKLEASNWHVLEVDGHDLEAIDRVFTEAKQLQGKPVLIDLKTVIGYGSPAKAGTSGVHGSPLGKEEVAATKQQLGWPYGSFEIPEQLLTQWRGFGKRCSEQYQQWQTNLNGLSEDKRAEFDRRLARKISIDTAEAVKVERQRLAANPEKIATRKASQLALEFFTSKLPELVGGSADLTGSNLTKVGGQKPFSADECGNYIHYGVREFAMCSAINGMYLHGGLRPYGGTFLVFSDYARNALRLSSLMGIGSIYVLTHDSIGLGEDGPTHQPVEHLASLRAIPNLQVFRPADPIETFECWELALGSNNAPSILALSRQGVPQLRNDGEENRSARGGYILAGDTSRQLTILATGTEVHLAVEAAELLATEGIQAAVVSMPCWELFDQQQVSYRDEVLGSTPIIAVEAASKFGWTRYVASEQDVIGMDGFGESAPATDLYKHLGITVAEIVKLAKKRIGN